MTLYEMETTIHFNEEEKIAYVDTCKKSLMKKFDKLCDTYPDDFKFTGSNELSRTYEVNKKLISIHTPKAKKILTDEEKEKLLERLSK